MTRSTMKSKSLSVATNGGATWSRPSDIRAAAQPCASSSRLRSGATAHRPLQPARQRLAGRGVAQLERQPQPDPPDVGDERVVAEPRQARLELGAAALGDLVHPLGLVDLERPGAGRGARAVPAVALDRRRRDVVAERLVDVLADDHRRDRRVARADGLGRDEHVGRDAPALDAPEPAGPAAAGQRLVGDHQDAVLVADLADPRPVVAVRDRELHDRDGLADERGDGLRALHLDRGPERLRRDRGRPPRSAARC